MERIKKVGKATKFGNVLREQNCDRRGIDNDLVKGLQSFYCTVEKFTIVELIFNKKRYHGISVKSDQDTQNLTEGIARAYLRAFDEMVEDQDLVRSPYENHLLSGLNNFSKALTDACCRMSTCVGPAPKNLEIGTLLVGDACVSEGVYEIRCHKCGKTVPYFPRSITSETKCPHCKRPLFECPE